MGRSRMFVLIGVVLTVVPCAGAAEGTDAHAWAVAIVEEERATERTVVGTVRARLAHPQGVGLAIGGLSSRLPSAWPCTAACDHRGATWGVEFATGGFSASAGWATVIGRRASRIPVLSHVFTAFGVRGVVTRTLDDAAWWGDGPRTLVGLEGTLGVAGANATFGVHRETAGPDPGRWVVAGGLGWGF